MSQIDHGPEPFITNIVEDTLGNDNFRTTVWTGSFIQLTLMSIEVGGEIGLEVHNDHDQFLRLESGQATVYIGKDKDHLESRQAGEDFAIIVPAGTWHNVVNAGQSPLKVYSIYGTPAHPHGTVHMTKADADAAESDG